MEFTKSGPCRVLRVLGRRCGPSTSWEDAVAVVVDELLPVPAVSVFRPVGRPRVDRSSAPPEARAFYRERRTFSQPAKHSRPVLRQDGRFVNLLLEIRIKLHSQSTENLANIFATCASDILF